MGRELQAFGSVLKTCLWILREVGNCRSSQILRDLGLKEKTRYWLAAFVDSRYQGNIAECRSRSVVGDWFPLLLFRKALDTVVTGYDLATGSQRLLC